MLNAMFFTNVRRKLLNGGSLSQFQVDALNAIYAEGVKRGATLAQIAYVIATPWHEVGSALVPIEEDRALRERSPYGRIGGVKSDGTRQMTLPYVDILYYGRGFPQLTFYDNYAKMGARLRLPLAEHPELLLSLAASVQALWEGMQYGLFTGKKLSDYINPTKTDFVNARRIVNGTDKASIIAGTAKTFYEALQSGVDFTTPPVQPTTTVVTAEGPVVQVPPPRGLIAEIRAWWKGNK